MRRWEVVPLPTGNRKLELLFNLRGKALSEKPINRKSSHDAKQSAHLKCEPGRSMRRNKSHPETSEGHAAAEDQRPNAHQPSAQVVGGLCLDDAVADGEKQNDAEPGEENKRRRTYG